MQTLTCCRTQHPVKLLERVASIFTDRVLFSPDPDGPNGGRFVTANREQNISMEFQFTWAPLYPRLRDWRPSSLTCGSAAVSQRLQRHFVLGERGMASLHGQPIPVLRPSWAAGRTAPAAQVLSRASSCIKPPFDPPAFLTHRRASFSDTFPHLDFLLFYL